MGPARLALGVAGSGLALFAGWWLVRAPAPPVESSIPMVTTTTSLPDASSPPVDSEPSVGVVIVHVAGAVRRPGVYEVAGTARVVDAVEAAGGATSRANLDSVNLARLLVDGEQIFIPRRGQTGGGADSARTPGGGASAPSGPVNVNSAGADRLQSLPGVGPATARAIIEHRQRNGPFASVDDLLEVPGIGPAKLEAMRGLVTV